MELMDPNKKVKQELMERSSKHRKALEHDLLKFTGKTETIIKNALIIGGALAGTYLLASELFKSTKSKKKSKHDLEEEEAGLSLSSAFSGIGGAIGNQLLIILLTLAKEKLAEYLVEKSQELENKE